MGSEGRDFCANSIEHEGRLYATLDCIPPKESRYGGTQSKFLEVPAGWCLAESSPRLIEAITRFPWGTSVLVFANGKSFRTSMTGDPGTTFNEDSLEREGNKVKPKNGSMVPKRVMITFDHTVDKDNDHCCGGADRLWEDKEFTDCELVSNGSVFKCHRAVLAQASPVFKRMFSGEMVEAKRRRVQFETVEPEAASSFLAYIYKGAMDVKSEHFTTLLKLLDFYQIECTTATTCNRLVNIAGKDNIVPIAMFMKRIRDRPDIAPQWSALVAKVQASKELTEVLLAHAAV